MKLSRIKLHELKAMTLNLLERRCRPGYARFSMKRQHLTSKKIADSVFFTNLLLPPSGLDDIRSPKLRKLILSHIANNTDRDQVINVLMLQIDKAIKIYDTILGDPNIPQRQQKAHNFFYNYLMDVLRVINMVKSIRLERLN